MALSDATQINNDNELSFAELVPVNASARVAFSRAVKDAQSAGDIHQLRFYKDGDLHLKPEIDDKQETETESESFLGVKPESALASLSLAASKLPEFPHFGWRVGKGDKNVDIRICAAGDQPSETMSISEFRLFIHPRSGLLCLQAGDIGRPVSIADIAQRIIPLKANEITILLQPINRIFVLNHEFEIRYTISKEYSRSFFSELQSFLGKYHQTSLHEAGRIYPSLGSSTFYGKYLVGDFLGDGTFGDVRYGINTKTGNPVAVKDVRVQNRAWRQETVAEILLLEKLKEHPHCLHILESWCGAHEVHPSDCPGRGREHLFIVTDLALFDFADLMQMKDIPFIQVLELSRQILLGIQGLHRASIMHRDISRKNCLVLSLDPAKAIIGDFGKAIQATQHTQTALGPIPTCAPEVWSKKYTNAIDVWSWAYMMAEYLGYKPTKADWNSPITTKRLTQITAFLEAKVIKEPCTAKLVDLLTGLLVWDVAERLDIKQALCHDVWSGIAAIEKVSRTDSGDDSPAVKRRRLKSHEASEKTTDETVPFSEEL